MPKIIEYFFRTFNESEEFIRMKQQYIYLFAGILSLWCAFLPFTQQVSERGSLIIHSVVLCSLTAAGLVLCLFKKQEAGVDIMFVTAGIYIVFYTGYFSDTFYLAALMILSLNAFLLHGKRYQYFIFTIAILAGLYMKYLRNMSDETIVFAVMGLAFLLILFIVKKNLNKIILSGSTLKEKILENQSISSQLEKAEQIAEQVVRPTGLIDPEIEVRPVLTQVDDVLSEINIRKDLDERVLVTTLTKRMAEDLSSYLKEYGVKVAYLHSDIDTVERGKIIHDLRSGVYDVLVGINLLREGLDMPEVSLVAILDADK